MTLNKADNVNVNVNVNVNFAHRGAKKARSPSRLGGGPAFALDITHQFISTIHQPHLANTRLTLTLYSELQPHASPTIARQWQALEWRRMACVHFSSSVVCTHLRCQFFAATARQIHVQSLCQRSDISSARIDKVALCDCDRACFGRICDRHIRLQF